MIESDFEVLIPEQYVENVSERIRLYRKLDSIPDECELQKFAMELEDRFGPLPEQVKDLMEIVRIRRLCLRLGIERLSVKNGRMAMYFVGEQNSAYYKSNIFTQILVFVQKQIVVCRFYEKNGKLSLIFQEIREVKQITQIVKEMCRICDIDIVDN